MNPTTDPTGTAEARAILDQLPDLYFSVLKNSQVEQQSGGEVRYSFVLPVLGKRVTSAPTALQAIRVALQELADLVDKIPFDEWSRNGNPAALSPQTRDQDASLSIDDKTKRFQAKARKSTIGATIPIDLKVSVQNIADGRQITFAELARHFVKNGFNDFDKRSYSESSEQLFTLLSSEVHKWQPSVTSQVMIRLDTYAAVRLRSAAKEYRRSVSEFGAMCLAHGLALQTQLVELEQKVALYRGAPLRKLAPQVGLDRHVALLAGILAGSICAPRRTLGLLSEILEAPQQVLVEFFKRSFQTRPLPAFKAENGKPQIVCSATPWDEAVKSLKLSTEQTSKLLDLDK